MAGMFPNNKEITVFGKTVKFPGVDENGKFTNGDFSNPDVPPSYLDAETLNLIIDNLNGLISHLGSSANSTDIRQLAALFTVAAVANKAVKRDEHGRAQVAAPAADDDIARKKEIDDIINGIVSFKKLTVLGDIIQKGKSYETHAEDVYTKNDMIHLREGAVSALADNALAGFIAEMYDGRQNGMLGFDRTGTARVGDENNTQPLATRAESAAMHDGEVVVWNAKKNRLETQGSVLDTIAESYNVGAIKYSRTFIIAASESIILTLGDGSYIGAQVKIINATKTTHKIRGTTARGEDSILLSSQIQSVIWNGSAWEGLSCPRIGGTYMQFPQQETPEDLFICTKWQLIDYGGAFFRSEGGNADVFEKTATVVSAHNAVLTFESGHGINIASILYDAKHNESRIVTAVSGNTVTVNKAFNNTPQNVIVGQHDQFQGHAHNYQGSDQSECNGYNETKQRYQVTKTTSGPVPLDNYGAPRYGNETRSANFTVRIWLRTA